MKCNYNIDTDFLNTLLNLEKIENITEKILEDGGKELVENEKKAIQHIQTGDMKKSIKATCVKRNQYGQYIVVRPTGQSTTYIDQHGETKDRKKPIGNMEKFVYTEYGTSQQSAHPIQKQVVNMSQSELENIATRIMQENVK